LGRNFQFQKEKKRKPAVSINQKAVKAGKADGEVSNGMK